MKLKDFLEDNVDDKYYLNERTINYVLDIDEKQKGTSWEGRVNNEILNGDIAHTLSVASASGMQRAGISNYVIDNYNDVIRVEDLKLKIKKQYKNGLFGSN